MKTLAALLLFMTTVTSAQETKSAARELEQDFTIVCEIAKMATKLNHTRAFKNSEARVAELKSLLSDTAVRTPEVKNALRAAAVASGKEKRALWKQAARDAGLRDWICESL